MTKLISLMVVLALMYLQVLDALKCYLCVGSTSSDCAAAKPTSMVEQECPVILIPSQHHRHHPHRHYHHHAEFDYDTATIVNDVIRSSMATTPILETENFAAQEAEATTSNSNELQKVYIPSCTYMKFKATNATDALVTRGCGYMPPKKEFCIIMKKVLENMVECKSCNTDICN